MSKLTKLKEAIKTGLAFVLVFGIALKLDWMSPSWAGWAVAVIALPTAGASIRKGGQRVIGTIPGCLAALAIQAMAPQDRWTFILLTSAWVFFTVYLMVSRPRDSYVWTMACYVCLIILLSDVDSSENMFSSAVFRTVETTMGVVVYTLISVFLWPQTNLGAIKLSSGELVTSLSTIFRTCRDTLLGQAKSEDNFPTLQGKVVQQLANFIEVLNAEGSESYEVSEVRPLWERFNSLANAVLENAGRLQSGFAELVRTDVRAAIPQLPAFCDVIDARFEAMQEVLAGRSPKHRPPAVRLEFDPASLAHLSHFDRAAVEVARKELLHLEKLTAAMLECALELGGQTEAGPITTKPLQNTGKQEQTSWLPVPDWDHLRSAAFVAATTGVGFLIWILFDPPGHSGWFQLSGTLALLVAISPQLPARKLIMPVAVTSAICLAIYVFIMPQLSSFFGLGTLLFTAMFLNCYLLSGMARFFCSMAILNMLPIQNQQLYSFAAMANVYLFIVGCFIFLYVMSYLLNSPRPEKVVLHLLDRFFRSAEFLMSRKTTRSFRLPVLHRWRTEFHERQLRSLPAKLAAWVKFIDHTSFPENTPEQIQAMVTSVQSLVYRLEQLMEAGEVRQAEQLARDLREDVRSWHLGIQSTFGRWAQHPEGEPVEALRQRLTEGFMRLEQRIEKVVNQVGDGVNREDAENFFRLLGGYRGVSEAALAYAGAAQRINWNHWREERFS